MNPPALQYNELVAGLHGLNPKKRGNPVSWIVLAGCAFVVGGLGLDVSVREAILSPAAAHRAPAFSMPAPNLPTGVQADMRVALPVVVVPPTTPAPVQVAPAPVQVAPAPVAVAPVDDAALSTARNAPTTKRVHSGKRHK